MRLLGDLPFHPVLTIIIKKIVERYDSDVVKEVVLKSLMEYLRFRRNANLLSRRILLVSNLVPDKPALKSNKGIILLTFQNNQIITYDQKKKEIFALKD